MKKKTQAQLLTCGCFEVGNKHKLDCQGSSSFDVECVTNGVTLDACHIRHKREPITKRSRRWPTS